jgi:hypothetical protein
LSGVLYVFPDFRPRYVMTPKPGNHPTNRREIGLKRYVVNGRMKAIRGFEAEDP